MLEAEDLMTLFSSYRYEELVKLEESFFLQQGITREDSIEVCRIMAEAHYALGNLRESAENYLRLLAVYPVYYPDQRTTSVKIISFFEGVREAYWQGIRFRDEQPEYAGDTVVTKEYIPILLIKNDYAPVWRTMLLPGWGRIYKGDIGKGAWTAGLFVFSAAAGVYFNSRVGRAERVLNDGIGDVVSEAAEVSNARIQRNLFWAAAAGIWLYAQFDIWEYFSDGAEIRLVADVNDFSPGMKFMVKVGF